MLYDAAVTYNAFGAISSVVDQDRGAGLDHTAAFSYDEAARLTSAVIGGRLTAYKFAYRYDGLQNMTQRTVQGPTALSILAGDYRYGEPGPLGGRRGPRQLTSIAQGGAPPLKAVVLTGSMASGAVNSRSPAPRTMG